MIQYNKERDKEGLIDLFEAHLTDEQKLYETLLCYDLYSHHTYVEYIDDKLIGVVSYFPSKHVDMIIAANTSNRFTKSMWKTIKNYLENRKRTTIIYSDPSNPVLHKGAKKYGGYFKEDVIIFNEEDSV